MKIQKKHLSVPLTAQLEITNLCNHRCLHCYNLDSDLQNRPIIKVNDETVIACAKKLIENDIFGVIITGGEPLIKRELTKTIIRMFKESGIKVSLNSNITLFDDDFIVFLKEIKVGVLTSCPSAVPSSFEKLVGINNYSKFEKKLKKMLASGLRFTVNMVVTKDNLFEVRTTAEMMKNLGCRSFAATPMGLNMEYPRLDLLLTIAEVQKVIEDLLWIEETLGMSVDVLEALPKCVFPEKILLGKHSFLNRKCQAGRTVIAVSCNGDVRPCAHNPISYGNILQDDLKTIWTNMGDWRSSQYIPKECIECTWLNRCNGGCRTSAKAITGNWAGKDMWTKSALKTLPSQYNQEYRLNNETKLQLNKEYRYRQEYEGVVVVYNQKDDIFFMINNTYYEFIVHIGKYDLICLDDLQREYSDEDSKALYEVIYFLIQKKILNIV